MNSASSASSSEDRLSLPSIGFDISRPSSTTSIGSSVHFHHYQQHQQQQSQLQHQPVRNLPSLSSLASLANAASTTPPADSPLRHGQQQHYGFPHSYSAGSPCLPHSMSATPGGASANQPPVCQNCSTSTTPLWRRDENGSVLCNACGLFLKLHGKPRPISLKTDVIKSRNRAKISAAGGAARRKPDGEPLQSLTATHPETASLDPSMRKTSQTHLLPPPLSRSHSPISRSITPNSLAALHAQNQQNSSIAPQHIFDSVISVSAASPGLETTLKGVNSPDPLATATFLRRTASPLIQLPAHYGQPFRAPSPNTLGRHNELRSSIGGTSITSVTASDLSPEVSADQQPRNRHTSLSPTSSDHLLTITALKTRVSELEVINDLFRGRVSELEAAETAAKDSEARIRVELEGVREREESLKRRLDEVERRMSSMIDYDSTRTKRMKVDDVVAVRDGEGGYDDGTTRSTEATKRGKKRGSDGIPNSVVMPSEEEILVSSSSSPPPVEETTSTTKTSKRLKLSELVLLNHEQKEEEEEKRRRESITLVAEKT